MKYFNSIAFKAVIGIFIFIALLVGSIFAVFTTVNKDEIENSSLSSSEITARKINRQLLNEMQSVQILALTLANYASVMDNNDNNNKKIIKELIGLHGQEKFILGGGVWPEPYAFKKTKHKASYFFARDKKGELAFVDDYNEQASSDYFYEEWYLPLKYVHEGGAYWSKSYIDPHTLEPMITVSAPIYKERKFFGVATIDIALSGLKKFLHENIKELGGYAFLLDREHKIITFPDDNLAKKNGQYRTFEELIAIDSRYKIIESLLKTSQSPSADKYKQIANELNSQSGLIDKKDADFIAWSLEQESLKSVEGLRAVKSTLLPDDALLREESMAIAIFEPVTSMTLVCVVPTKTVLAQSNKVFEHMMMTLFGLSLLSFVIGYLVVKRGFIAPIVNIAKHLSDPSTKDSLIDEKRDDEIGLLIGSLNKKTKQNQTLLSDLDRYVIYSRTDLDGKIVYASSAFCEISGYSKDELIGKNHNIVRHPDNSKELYETLWNYLKNSGIWRGELKNIRKDGSSYWVESVISVEFDDDGDAIGYIAIRNDITAKKDTESLSAQLKEQLAEIQRFHTLTSGREARMIELKKEVNEYATKLSLELPYGSFEDEVTESQALYITEEHDISVSDLKELLDSDRLQVLMEYFYNFMHIPLAIIDLEANILVQSKWQRACTDFHRVNEDSCKKCIESDIDIAKHLQNGEKFTIHKCKNGMTDCASPIIINGKHLANFFIGQFMVNKPDEEFFKKQAIFYSYDVNDYIEAIKDVPVVDEYKLSDILGFLVEITNIVTSLTIEKMNAKLSSDILVAKSEEMRLSKLTALNLAEDANRAKNELIKHQEHLEEMIAQRTAELNDERGFVSSVMNSQDSLVISTDGFHIRFANRATLDFYGVANEQEFMERYGDCICDTFDVSAPDGYLQKMMDGQKWVEYVYQNKDIQHKAVILQNGARNIFSVSAETFEFKGEMLSVAVFNDITQMEKAKEEIEKILANILLPVLITSKKERKILYANKYAEIMYETSAEELVGSSIDEIYTISGQQHHILEILTKYGRVENKKELFKTAKGREFTALLSVTPIVYNDEEAYIGMVTDISEIEKAKEEIANSNLLMKQLLDSIPSPIFYKNEEGRFIGFNQAYESVFGIDSKELLGRTVMELEYLPLENRQLYNDEDMNIIHTLGSLQREQEMVFADNKSHSTLYSVNSYTKIDGTPGGLIGIFTDITEQKEIEKEIRLLHKHTRESIEYASLIQHSLIPAGDTMRAYFGEHFVIWHPKDIVGGDIYFFETLNDGDECILFVIDCTGHGVPGAFVSMLVKAIERQITSNIKLKNEEVSPAKILAIYNKNMKSLLRQESDEAISNAGFDGAIIYSNKKTGVLKFASAQTPLFYVENGALKVIKGDRHSIGYKKSDANFEFTEHHIQTSEGMCFYISTDGYLDQNGGDKGFPFGKKKFSSVIEQYHMESFADQQEIFLDELKSYQKDEIRNDDITLIGFRT